jgi:hypothetical protein
VEEARDRVAGPLLLLVVGASGSGKTAVLDPLRQELAGIAVHEFDEIGVPSNAKPSWRQRANEEWLRAIIDRDAGDRALLLLGQTPLGELLATPSAVQLGGIACCLMDCDDDTRRSRLDQRAGWTREKMEWHLEWAGWLRGHALDPQWRQEVIRHPYAPPELEWRRWAGWPRGDPRWRCTVIDTSALAVRAVAQELARWARTQRETYRLGKLPLSGRWWLQNG